jgi:endonuclease/exonuclease/phosphatase (EEP) superfamily protein YafD
VDDLVDLASIQVPGLAVVGLPGAAVAAVMGVWWVTVVSIVVSAAVLVVCWLPRRRQHALPAPAKGEGGVTVLAANLWCRNRRTEQAVRDLVAADADVVVISELGQAAHELLVQAFEHHEVMSIGGSRGHGVYSRFPVERLEGAPVTGPVLHLRVDGPFSFELFGAHTPRPTVWARPHPGSARLGVCRAEMYRLAEFVEARSNGVVAGDLNLSDRQPGYRRLIAGRLDAMRTGRPGNTFHGQWFFRLFAMRIDHLVVPAGWRVSEARPVRVTGSDHRAVCARIAPPAA